MNDNKDSEIYAFLNHDATIGLFYDRPDKEN